MLIWVCSCITFQYVGWNIFIFCPNFRDQLWRCTYFDAKLEFIAGTFLRKYPWCMKINFRFYFFAIWSISASILSIIAWKAPISRKTDKMDSWCFGQFGKFQDTKEISRRRPVFSDYLSVSCDYARTKSLLTTC